METEDGAHVHNAIFPTKNKYSLFMNNAKYSFRNKVERIIPSEVRETRTDKYPMVSLPGIN